MATGLERALLDAEHHALLREHTDVLDDAPLTQLHDDRATEVLASTDVLLTGWGCPLLDADVLDRAPHLRLVAHAAGTVRPIVTPALFDRGVLVTTAAGANARPVAEFTVAVITLTAKDLFAVRDRYRSQRGVGRAIAGGSRLGTRGRRIGLVGASRIGRLVIELLRPHDVVVSVSDPYLDEAEAARLGVARVELDELLRTNDLVSLHAPDLPTTRHLIGAPQLAALPDGAWLVNTARGALIDTAALEAELATGRINAVIDTPEPEPLPPESPLWDLPNVVLTPHIAGSIGVEVGRLGAAAVDEIIRFASGRPPADPVRRADLDRIA